MTHKLYKAGALAALLLAAPGTHILAQKTQELTLNEAVQLSLQNSKQLKMSKAKVDEAVANTKDMWNNHLPDVKASGAYLRVNNPTINLKTSLGGSSSSSDTTKKSGGGMPKVNSAAYGMVTASLPLFSGLRIKYGVESAKFLEEAAKLNAENDKEEVVANTIEAYSNLYKAMRTVQLIQEDLKEQDRRVTDFTNLEANGIIARNDLLKAQLQKSNVELSLLEAQSNYRITSTNMDLMLGLSEELMLVPDSTGFQLQGDAGSVAQWEENAMKNRKDFQALGYNEQAAQAGIKATKGEYYPSVAITGGYIGIDIPNIANIPNAFNAGIGLQYNFGALWKTGAKVDVAKARLNQVQASKSMMTDQLHLQVTQAYENYLLSNKKIEVYNTAVEQARENYRITKNK